MVKLAIGIAVALAGIGGGAAWAQLRSSDIQPDVYNISYDQASQAADANFVTIKAPNGKAICYVYQGSASDPTMTCLPTNH